MSVKELSSSSCASCSADAKKSISPIRNVANSVNTSREPNPRLENAVSNAISGVVTVRLFTPSFLAALLTEIRARPMYDLSVRSISSVPVVVF